MDAPGGVRRRARAAGMTDFFGDARASIFDDDRNVDRDARERASIHLHLGQGTSALESAAAAAEASMAAAFDARRTPGGIRSDLDLGTPLGTPDSTSWAAAVSSRDDALAVTLDAARRGVPTVTTDAPLRRRRRGTARFGDLVDPRSLETRRRVIGGGETGATEAGAMRVETRGETGDGDGPVHVPVPVPVPVPPNVPSPYTSPPRMSPRLTGSRRSRRTRRSRLLVPR